MPITDGVLKTPDAVQALGRSKSQLLRLVDAGVLTPGVHFFRGPFRNSPITWDVGACQQRFAELARMPVPPQSAEPEGLDPLLEEIKTQTPN